MSKELQTCPASLAQEEASPTSEVVYIFFSDSAYKLSLKSKRLTYTLEHCLGPKWTSTLSLLELFSV